MRDMKNNWLINKIQTSLFWYSRVSLLLLFCTPWLYIFYTDVRVYIEYSFLIILMTLGCFASWRLWFCVSKFTPKSNDLDVELWRKIDLNGILAANIEIHSIFSSIVINSRVSNYCLIPLVIIDLLTMIIFFIRRQSNERLVKFLYVNYLAGLISFFSLVGCLFNKPMVSIFQWGVIPFWLLSIRFYRKEFYRQ